MHLRAALTAALVGLFATGVAAQTTFQSRFATRGFIAAGAITQAPSGSVIDRFEFQEFVEEGTIDARFEPGMAIGFDGSAGVRIWRNLGIGAGITTYAPPRASGGRVTARLPHPFDFGQHREVTGDAGLERKETAIHGSLLYFAPIGSRVLAVIGAGPTFFQAEQSFVRDVRYTHEYPYDTATFQGADIDHESASGVGFNASLDVSWRFSRSFGAGAVVRYTQASLPFTPGTGETARNLTVNLGGLQAGAGLRLLF